MKYHVVGWDGPTLSTWEVEADHVLPGSSMLVFTVGPDPLTVGIGEAMPFEVARFVTDNVLCFFPVEANGEPLPERVKQIS